MTPVRCKGCVWDERSRGDFCYGRNMDKMVALSVDRTKKFDYCTEFVIYETGGGELWRAEEVFVPNVVRLEC